MTVDVSESHHVALTPAVPEKAVPTRTPSAEDDRRSVARARRRPLRRIRWVIAVLAVLVLVAVLVRVLLGDYTVAFVDLVRILRGDPLPEAPGRRRRRCSRRAARERARPRARARRAPR